MEFSEKIVHYKGRNVYKVNTTCILSFQKISRSDFQDLFGKSILNYFEFTLCLK